MLSQWSDIFLLEAFEFHETGVVVEWAVWQYGLWSFQTRGTKLERFLHQNQYTQRKLLNFENWVNGEMSKIGHHFRKKSDLKN